MTAGELREALDGVDDDMEVLLRLSSDDGATVFGVASSAVTETGHEDEVEMFTIDAEIEEIDE